MKRTRIWIGICIIFFVLLTGCIGRSEVEIPVVKQAEPAWEEVEKATESDVSKKQELEATDSEIKSDTEIKPLSLIHI